MRELSSPTSILLVEDDADFREGLAEWLKRGGYQVLAAADTASALASVSDVDVLITDVRLPDGTGIELLERAKGLSPALQVIVMTGYGTVRDAVEAMRRGAATYLTKPFEPEELLLHLRQMEEVIQLRRVASAAGRGDLVGRSQAMRAVYGSIDVASASQAPVLITGETGTGKELAARAIHALSARSRHPFLAVDLGALPGDLIESELFGHERGAFTGAIQRKLGRFALAGDGTLLLDELGSLPLDLQPKLLRAIEAREFWPVGSDRPLPFRGRLLAATNTGLPARISAGAFRQDLYYRLNVLTVSMPPLRDHPEDIPGIAVTLLDRIGASSGAKESPPVLAPDALALLVTHPWAGNVRELANALEKGVAKVWASRRSPAVIGVEDLELPADRSVLEIPFREGRVRAADAWSRTAIATALASSEGNVTRAAERLQMNTSALFRLIKKLGLKA